MACVTCGRGGIDVDNCYDHNCPFKRYYPDKEYNDKGSRYYGEYESQFYSGRRSSGCLPAILALILATALILQLNN